MNFALRHTDLGKLAGTIHVCATQGKNSRNAVGDEMKFEKETATRILTQVAIHAPKKKGASLLWTKGMVLPSHIKHGLRFEDKGDKVIISFDGTSLGFMRYGVDNVILGVYHLTNKGK